MTISKAKENGKLVIVIEGRLDTGTAPRFQDALIPEFDKEKDIQLDFTQLAYVSSAGLRVLIIGHKTAKEKNASMTIKNVSQEVMDVFNMTGFTDMLTIV